MCNFKLIEGGYQSIMETLRNKFDTSSLTSGAIWSLYKKKVDWVVLHFKHSRFCFSAW